jgi:CHAT domain-containing protein
MNQARINQYVELIQNLLSCPDGEEPQILQAHEELLDTEFTTYLIETSKQYQQVGRQGEAKFLNSLAEQILNSLLAQLKPYIMGENSHSLEEYKAFLLEVLEAESQTNDIRVIYPILRKHQHLLDENFAHILQNLTLNYAQENPEAKEYIAGIVENLCLHISDFPLGRRANNLEIAITGHKTVLTLFPCAAFPYEWATTQNNLGLAYNNRIKGDRGENLEQAIAAYNLVLDVYTRAAFPYEWATTQNNLGNAYCERIKGDRGENIEQAIAAYELALQVRTRKAFPQDWATTQNNLATAYCERIKGDRGENIEQAIAAYELALQVHTRAAFPEQWATTQNNLGNAYKDRIKRDRGENIEQAIAAYELALQVRTRAAFPEQWATTQNNLATAYCERIKGDRGENIEHAIATFNLALEEYTRAAFPEQWAMTQNNLGIAYKDRIKGDKGENIELAIATFNLALQVYTCTAFPDDWAGTQNNLGNAYKDRIKGDRGENIENAIKCYDHALEIRTPESFPIECLGIGRNLGDLGFKEGNWTLAIRGYEIAIEAVETSRSWATDDQRRNEILANAITVYENIIQSYIELKQYDKAIEYAERSRSRRLVDLMASNDVYSKGEIPEQVKQYLQEFYQIDVEIENQRQSKNKPPEQKPDLAIAGNKMGNSLSSLQETQENIKELQNQQTQIWKEIRKLDPVLAGQIKVEPLEFAQLQSLITSDKTAILSFYTTSQHTHIFILTQSDIQIHTCQQQSLSELQNYLIKNWLNPYIETLQLPYLHEQWLENIPHILQEISHRLNINALVENYLQNIEELIIIPHLYLHLIPFSALPINSSQSPVTNHQSPTISDKFLIRIVPSCQILKFCQDRGELDQLNFGIVENATDDRHITSFAGEQLTQFFHIPTENRLQGSQKATVNNYRQLAQRVQILHSIHHASYDLNNPLQSALQLGDGDITLGELLTPGWRLPNLSDVFLSCCETGLGLPQQLADDILTLAAGFLCAGARSVISTLWSVDALGTTLFCLFYYQHRQAGNDRATALQLAQRDLRNKTAKELTPQFKQIDKYLLQVQNQIAKELKNEFNEVDFKEVDKYLLQVQNQTTKLIDEQIEKLREYITTSKQIGELRDDITTMRQQPTDKPFESPYYWAAFTCQGLR